MNNIERIFHESADARSFAEGYLKYLGGLLASVDVGAVARFIAELEKARRGGNTVFIAGNGGSAATASHMANDLGIGVNRGNSGGQYRVMSLCDNNAVLTAVANDSGYDEIFLSQLRVHYRAGDLLVVISASGNSPNVVRAAQWVKERGGMVMGLLGFDGGKLKDLCGVLINVQTPKGEYGPVEDVHMVMDHLIYSWLTLKVGKEAAATPR